jgi:hypothetical protein
VAKEIYPCGGIGKHLGDCDCGSGSSGGGSRRKGGGLGKAQRDALRTLRQGGKIVEEWGGTHLDRNVARSLVERGLARQVEGDEYEITNAGRDHIDRWERDQLRD